MTDLTKYRTFAEDLAISAGRLVLEGKKSFKVVKHKDLQDVATTIDVASEKLIMEAIRKKFPDHSIFSEESPEISKKSDYRWVVDPLDGTKAYVRGIPLYNVSICLEYKGEAVAGVIYLPATKELYSAASGEGAFLNGTRISVSEQESLASSYVGFYTPTKNRKFVEYEKGWQTIIKISEECYRVRQEASSNIALCWLSQGGIEAYVNITNPPHHHDLVTGLLVAKEAGALINEFPNGTFIIANNKYIYSSLTDIIKI